MLDALIHTTTSIRCLCNTIDDTQIIRQYLPTIWQETLIENRVRRKNLSITNIFLHSSRLADNELINNLCRIITLRILNYAYVICNMHLFLSSPKSCRDRCVCSSKLLLLVKTMHKCVKKD